MSISHSLSAFHYFNSTILFSDIKMLELKDLGFFIIENLLRHSCEILFYPRHGNQLNRETIHIYYPCIFNLNKAKWYSIISKYRFVGCFISCLDRTWSEFLELLLYINNRLF